MTRPNGFTLLEVLVATTVLGLLTLTLSGGLHFGMRVWEAGERRAGRLETVAAVQDLMRRLLEQAHPLTSRRGEPAILFDGGRDRLRFVSVLPPRMGPSGLADMTLSLVDGGRLQLAWQALGERDRPATARVLLEGVDGLTLSYYGGATRTAAPVWRDDWIGAGFPPALVRIAVRFSDGRTWPDLLAAPAVTVDSLID